VIEVTGAGYLPHGEFREGGRYLDASADPQLTLALRIGVLCADASLINTNGVVSVLGDPTEGGLLVAPQKAGIDWERLKRDFPRIGESPFTSESKRMVTIHLPPEGREVAYIKGAPSVILEASQQQQCGNNVLPLSSVVRKQVLAVNERLAARALRILSFAYENSSENWSEEDWTHEVVLVGLVGLAQSANTVVTWAKSPEFADFAHFQVRMQIHCELQQSGK
jgi:Ca2+-transporting ATPase